MSILKEVLAELLGMFIGDVRLSAAVLGVVALSAVLIELAKIDPLIGGAALLAGCLAVVVEGVLSAARRQRAKSDSGPE
jgi:hypothetical protein